MHPRVFGLGLMSVAMLAIASAQIAQQLQDGGDFVFKFNGADCRIGGRGLKLSLKFAAPAYPTGVYRSEQRRRRVGHLA